MSDDTSPQLYPAWRHAQERLLVDGLSPGTIIAREWLMAAFGLREPQTVSEVQRNALIFLRQMSELRDSLLEKHNVMLRPFAGVGYQVVPPEHQTAVAMKDRADEIKRAFKKLQREISHVQIEALDDAQRKQNSDAIAKVGALRALIRPNLESRDHDDDPEVPE